MRPRPARSATNPDEGRELLDRETFRSCTSHGGHDGARDQWMRWLAGAVFAPEIRHASYAGAGGASCSWRGGSG